MSNTAFNPEDVLATRVCQNDKMFWAIKDKVEARQQDAVKARKEVRKQLEEERNKLLFDKLGITATQFESTPLLFGLRPRFFEMMRYEFDTIDEWWNDPEGWALIRQMYCAADTAIPFVGGVATKPSEWSLKDVLEVLAIELSYTDVAFPFMPGTDASELNTSLTGLGFEKVASRRDRMPIPQLSEKQIVGQDRLENQLVFMTHDEFARYLYKNMNFKYLRGDFTVRELNSIIKDRRGVIKMQTVSKRYVVYKFIATLRQLIPQKGEGFTLLLTLPRSTKSPKPEEFELTIEEMRDDLRKVDQRAWPPKEHSFIEAIRRAKLAWLG